MEHFEKILVLSTGHMPNTSPRFGDFRVVKFEYGYVVWVSEYCHTRRVVLAAEDWFKPIMRYAHENGCTLILFDSAEAPDEELFSVYEW
jgi:hypothetical protein